MAGIFETIRVRNRQVPFLQAHLDRLAGAVAALHLTAPRPGLEGRVRALATAPDAVVRVTLDQRGERIEARPVPAAGPMRIVFSGTAHEPYPWKTTGRDVFDRARSRVVPYRADEVILMTRDRIVAEGCVTSVFFWMGAELCTPALDVGILPGVGRARVIEAAKARGIPVREERFPREVVEGLPLFLVNSVRGVVEAALHGDWRRTADDRTRKLADTFWG